MKVNEKVADFKVAIIGGGLVGSLNACFLANRGYNVVLYEYRSDIRSATYVRGRSINLALSVRGLSALKAIGLDEKVLQHAIPMHARMIHDLDGTRHSIPYGNKGQSIYSVDRRYLNEIILSEAERNTNVSIRFEHKLVDANLRKGNLLFKTPNGQEVTAETDLIVGCDGAFSTVRKQMLKEPQFAFSQKYIEHGYLELVMPPDPTGNFAMEGNFLHIWPRGNFMLIALPNQDRSYTVTLFMPFEKFQSLDSSETLVKFFREIFPDALNLIGQSQLIQDYFAMKPSHLLTVKCSPYHVSDKAVIMGDAAHAMVPFYGQGMNAGFEDCLIFDQFMDDYDSDLGKAMSEFSSYRNPDAEAICDLALYNYIEMRYLITTKSFLIRKCVDRVLHFCFPTVWVPLYTMVTFSRTRYHLCIENRKWQDKILGRAKFLLIALAIGLPTIALGTHYINQIAIRSF